MTFKDFMTDVLLVAAIPVVAVVTWKGCKLIDNSDKRVTELAPVLEKANSVLGKVDRTADKIEHGVNVTSEFIDDIAKGGAGNLLATCTKIGNEIRNAK